MKFLDELIEEKKVNHWSPPPFVEEKIKERCWLIKTNFFAFKVNDKELIPELEKKEFTDESFGQALTDKFGSGKWIQKI